MPLTIRCSSGHPMTVSEEAQGKRVRCPKCQEIVTVPQAAPPPSPRPVGGPPMDLGEMESFSVPLDLVQHVQAPGQVPPPGPPLGPPSPGNPPARSPERDYDRGRDYAPRDSFPTRGEDRGYDRERGYGRERDRDYDRNYDRGRGYGRGEDYPGDGALTPEEASQLHTVSLGLAFQGWQHLLYIVMFCLLTGIAILASLEEILRRQRGWMGRRGGGEELIQILGPVLVIILGLTALLAIVFIFIGVGMCLRAPTRTGAAPFALVGMICHGVWVFMQLLMVFILIASGGRGPGDGAALLLGMAGVLGILLFITGQIMQNIYWLRLGGFLNDGRARAGAIGTMVAWLVAIVLIPVVAVVGLNVMLWRANPTLGYIFLVLMGVMGLAAVMVHAFMMGTVSRLRGTLQAYLHEERR